jgi:hypothetical protein
MGSPKIKKRGAAAAPVSKMPRQAALPCLVLVGLALILVAVLMYYSLRTGLSQ